MAMKHFTISLIRLRQDSSFVCSVPAKEKSRVEGIKVLWRNGTCLVEGVKTWEWRVMNAEDDQICVRQHHYLQAILPHQFQLEVRKVNLLSLLNYRPRIKGKIRKRSRNKRHSTQTVTTNNYREFCISEVLCTQ